MIEYSRNTSVFVTFLDASKAYDNIDHWQLFNKLLNIHVPVFIVNILVYWYSRQEMFIRWGNTYSTKYIVTNGVKQGGILFPCLFNVYLNNLSLSLNSSSIGGSLGDNVLDIRDTNTISHKLSYNTTKSYSLCFRPKQIKMNPPSFVLGKQLISAVDRCKYLCIIVSEANCDGDLKRQMRKYYANAIMLLRKFCYCSPDVKCCMFKSYCLTMYC